MNAPCLKLAEQFDDSDQQRSAANLGMWAFIATEVLFFGALFLVYTVYRTSYPIEVANAAQKLNLTIGTINTAILLTSSFFVALGVSAIQTGKAKRAALRSVQLGSLGLHFFFSKSLNTMMILKNISSQRRT